MSGARITVDGLWRCLCPSIDAAALATAITVPYRPRRASRRLATTVCARPRAAPRRHLHTTPRRLQDNGAQKEEESCIPVVDTEAKAKQDVAPESSDFGDQKPAVKIDQEATKAWSGYFDVVLSEAIEEQQSNNLRESNEPVEDTSPEVAAAEAQWDPLGVAFDTKKQQREYEFLPLSNHIGDQCSSTVASVKAGKDPLDELFGTEEKKQHVSPDIHDLGGDSSPTSADAEAGNDLFDDVFGTSVDKGRFDALVDADNAVLGDFTKPMGADQGGSVSGPTTEETIAATVDELPSAQQEGKSRVRSSIHTEMADRLLKMKPPFKDVPPEAEKGDILNALVQARMRGPRKFRRITATLLKHLISMDPKPKALYYDILFRAHCVPEGSADVIADLLQEMRREKVHWSSSAYHSVLRALAVHPDYLMRNVAIQEMKERWIDITSKGHRYIMIGLLRDEQYELALEKLEQMIQQGIEVVPWVFDIFIYVFGKLGFLDDALRLVRHRLDRGFEVSVNIWYFLLDVSSKGQNHEVTAYVWNRTVQQGIVNPSDGVALNILNMASVYGDTELATQVIQYLAERGTRLSRPHYEALADAYSMQGNVERAIEVYCIMYGAGAEVNHASAGTLCQSLSRDPARIDKAVEAMAELKNKYKLPVGIFNAVLNEMVKSSALPPEEAFVRGLDLYRRIREFLPTGPNWETFRNLLWRCTRPDIAQFLAGEMIAFNIRQNLVIIELMFKVNVEHNGPTYRVKTCFYKVAPHLHSDYAPGSRRWQNVMNLSVKLVKRLIAERDPEAWRILDICKRNGLEEDKVVALREEVETGRLATMDAPPLPDVPEGDWPGLRHS